MTQPKSSGFGARVRRWFASAQELEAEEMAERARDSGAMQVAECEDRAKVKLRGTISDVTAGSATQWLEANFTDGSGEVKLVWMGHDQLSCIFEGQKLLVTGRLSKDEDQAVMYNPSFEVVD